MAITRRPRLSTMPAGAIAILALALPWAGPASGNPQAPAPAPATATATAPAPVTAPAPATALAPATNGHAVGTLQPYKARYQVSYRGIISGGEIECSFRPGPVAGEWLYDTRAFPNLLARAFVSPRAGEHSRMMLTESGIRPMSYEMNDGNSDPTKQIKVTFDWTKQRVSGVDKGKPFDFEVPPGTQDTASAQAAMINERLAGRMPTGYPIVTGDEVNNFRYWSEGLEKVETPFGKFEAEVWANQKQRARSDRMLKVWLAPTLGYVPVQAVQYRKGNPEWQMQLVGLQR